MAERDDILIESALPATDGPWPFKARLAAFVPLTIAILGVGAVLFGGLSARHEVTAEIPAIDSIATGSIAKE